MSSRCSSEGGKNIRTQTDPKRKNKTIMIKIEKTKKNTTPTDERTDGDGGFTKWEKTTFSTCLLYAPSSFTRTRVCCKQSCCVSLFWISWFIWGKILSSSRAAHWCNWRAGIIFFKNHQKIYEVQLKHQKKQLEIYVGSRLPFWQLILRNDIIIVF